MRLDSLLDGLLPGSHPAIDIGGLHFDSRAISPGDLFVALAGHDSDGHDYIEAAKARGAVAVLAERPLVCELPLIVAPEARSLLGLMADRWHASPSQELEVIAVTGTNGKTTTCFLLHALLSAAGVAPSLVGTVRTEIAGRRRSADCTTPDALSLHALLAATRDAGARHFIMEASSHALDQQRLAGLRLKLGLFTNLSQDHLDYHGSMAEYLEAKAQLFQMLEPDGLAVLNADDPASARLAELSKAPVLRYGTDPAQSPELLGTILGEDLGGCQIELRRGAERTRLALSLVGRHNVENALAALGAALGLGYSLEQAASFLESAAPAVPGRLERVSLTNQPAVFVDYAHTDDALERVCATIKPLTPGRLHVVFGCGGDRDRGKRPLMAQAVARWADEIVLTSDNPRSEDPGEIAADVQAGLGAQRHRVILDRAEAIAASIAAADPRDTVLIAGKGHEAMQIFASGAAPFDDRDQARAALATWPG